MGLSVKGGFWARPNVTWGMAWELNGISAVHRDCLAGGGTGILAADGKLNYALEEFAELYYNHAVMASVY